MNQSDPQAGDIYFMGRTSAEYERLRQQAKIWEESTRTLFSRVGLTAGMSCLDVGCGPGEVMRLMGEYVGATGRVLGLDVDGKLGREALATLRSAGGSQFEFQEGNVETLEWISDVGFDLIYARLVLVHLRDPMATLKKLWGWLRPGGWLVIQEYAFGGAAAYPPCELFEEWQRTFFGVCERTGKSPHLGMQIPALFVEGGLGKPDGTHVAGRLGALEEYIGIMAAAYRSTLPIAIQLGVTTQERGEWFFQQVDNLPQDRYYSLLSPLLLGTWKQKK